jgi:transcriptional regulator with XRE-family HTH domain
MAIVFHVKEMSPLRTPDLVAVGLAAHVGLVIADSRRARHWTLRELADRTGVSVTRLHDVEHGRPTTLATYAAIGAALGLTLHLDLVDPRRRATAQRAEDPVHAAMGERIAAHLTALGSIVGIDEPYQHYQFAGRADLVAWDREQTALLHVENRTRFPNIQEAIGAYNAKRRYLPGVIAERLGLRQGFASVTHVIVALWSAEVLHDVRLRSHTFRAVCPDDITDFEVWWSGDVPRRRPSTSSLILFDPAHNLPLRARTFIGLEAANSPSTRPRYRGYAEAAQSFS